VSSIERGFHNKEYSLAAYLDIEGAFNNVTTQSITGIKLANKYMGLYEVIQVKRNGRYDVKNAADFEDPLQTSTSADFMKLRRYASKEEEDENLSSEEEEASVTDVLQDGRK